MNLVGRNPPVRMPHGGTPHFFNHRKDTDD